MTGRLKKDNLKQKAKKIKFVLFDVDGTLTDGQLIFGPHGEIYKSFNIKDGMGIYLAQQAGIPVGLISGRSSQAVEKRAKELEIRYLWQGIKDKAGVFTEILGELSLKPEEVAFMGDDLNDLALLKAVGLSSAVADAIQEVREAVDYVTEKKGGRGAARELLDFIRGVKSGIC